METLGRIHADAVTNLVEGKYVLRFAKSSIGDYIPVLTSYAYTTNIAIA